MPKTTLVTLVHGTWARNAPWIQPESDFCASLSASTDRTIQFLPFNWSGRNNHGARLKAGEQLASHIKKHHKSHPDSPHFVIAHSHGGNVALYALRDENAVSAVTGLITLATPFIVIRDREIDLALKIVAKICAFFAFIYLWVFLSNIATPHLLSASGWIVLAGIVAAIFLTFILWGAVFGLAEAIEEGMGAWLSSRQDEWIDRLSYRIPVGLPVLATRFSIDEASFGLRAFQFVSEIAPMIARILSYLTVGLFFITIFLSLPGFSLIPVLTLILDWDPASVESYIEPLNVVPTVLIACFWGMVIFYIIGTLSRWAIAGGHGFALLENPFRSLLVRMMAVDIEAGDNIAVYKFSLHDYLEAVTEPGLWHRISRTIWGRHSFIYRYPVAIQSIADWINQVTSGVAVMRNECDS